MYYIPEAAAPTMVVIGGKVSLYSYNPRGQVLSRNDWYGSQEQRWVDAAGSLTRIERSRSDTGASDAMSIVVDGEGRASWTEDDRSQREVRYSVSGDPALVIETPLGADDPASARIT
jgi:hypothetical protein